MEEEDPDWLRGFRFNTASEQWRRTVLQLRLDPLAGCGLEGITVPRKPAITEPPVVSFAGSSGSNGMLEPVRQPMKVIKQQTKQRKMAARKCQSKAREKLLSRWQEVIMINPNESMLGRQLVASDDEEEQRKSVYYALRDRANNTLATHYAGGAPFLR